MEEQRAALFDAAGAAGSAASALTCVVLNWNELGMASAVALARALRPEHDWPVEEMDLLGNAMGGSAGAERVAEALEQEGACDALRDLKLMEPSVLDVFRRKQEAEAEAAKTPAGSGLVEIPD